MANLLGDVILQGFPEQEDFLRTKSLIIMKANKQRFYNKIH